MEAIRQFAKVVNHQVHITLPDDFDAEEVEIIIMTTSQNFQIPEWQLSEVRERTSEYNKDKSIGLNFDDVIKKLENEL